MGAKIPEIIKLESLDISILIVVFGAIFIYFGRIISETQVEKYDQHGYYEQGLLFSAIYIYIPSLISYYIYATSPLVVSSLGLIIIQIVVFICLLWNLISNAYFIKYELLDEEFLKKAEEKHEQIKMEDSFVGRTIKDNDGESIDFKKLINLFYYKIPVKIIGNKSLLIIFSLTTIISNFQLYKSSDLLILGFSLLLAFFILTMVALAYGYSNAYYPFGKIYMVDGTIIEGKILKFGEYVSVLKGDKKFFINNDKISYIVESKFKQNK